MDTIFKRNSIRSYKSEEVSEENIKRILRAGMAAPSAENKDPWEFVFTTNREILDEIASKHPHAKMVKEAPLCIAICANSEKQPKEGYYIQDCSAAVENMLLETELLGLGGVWIVAYPHKDLMGIVRDIFNIPSNIHPMAMIAVGHPDEFKRHITEYDENIVHEDQY